MVSETKAPPRMVLRRTTKVLVIAVLLSTVRSGWPSVESGTEAVLSRQQAYLGRITSLAFHAKVVLNLTTRAQEMQGLSVATLTHDMRFVSSGSKFRSEVTYLDVSQNQTITTTRAYDGRLYQVMNSDANPTLFVSSRSIDNAYGGLHPILAVFRFAIARGDTLTLDALNKSEKWSGLGQSAVSHEETTMLNHPGVKIGLRVPSICCAGEDAYEVFFASDLAYLPVYWRAVLDSGAISECKVTSTKLYDEAGGAIQCPTRIEFLDYLQPGTLGQTGYIEVAPQSLKINEPVDPSVFTIPPTSAYRYLDQDTGVAITQ